jgi:hypothetical protein
MIRFTLALASLLLLTAALDGCGHPSAIAPAPRAAQEVAAQAALDPAAYAPATFDQVSAFWDREGSAANHGKKFAITGTVSAHPPDHFLEGWGAQMAGKKDDKGHTPYAWVVVNKGFLTRGLGERYFEKMGANTGEEVTLFLAVKKADSTANRVKIDGVKRADGRVVKL